MGESDRHLDPLQLDALRAGDNADPDDARHVAGCAQCRDALAELNSVAAALKRLHAPALEPSTDRDAQILWRARSEAARVRRQPLSRQRRALLAPATWAAVAVGLLALAAVMLIGRRHAAPTELTRVVSAPAPRPQADVDIDSDGRVTVLDAFLLARQLESAAADPSHPARVEHTEVDAVLAMAVSIRGT